VEQFAHDFYARFWGAQAACLQFAAASREKFQPARLAACAPLPEIRGEEA